MSYGVCGVMPFPPQAAAATAALRATFRLNFLHICCSTCAALMDDGEFCWWASLYFPHLFERMGDGPLHIWISRKFGQKNVFFPRRSNEAAVSYVYWRCWFYYPLTWLSPFSLLLLPHLPSPLFPSLFACCSPLSTSPIYSGIIQGLCSLQPILSLSCGRSSNIFKDYYSIH